jgi:hypothetical protein
MSWSLKNSTLYFKSNELISDISAGSREATPKLMLPSSAPMLQVSGSTRIEFCSAPADTIAGALRVEEFAIAPGIAFPPS